MVAKSRAKKKSPPPFKLKKHPAHTFTKWGVEIGFISAATRNPDGSKVRAKVRAKVRGSKA